MFKAFSDYIRLKLVQGNGGWFLDGDSIWLCGAPDLRVSPPLFGHCFHTMRASPIAPRGSEKSRMLFWELHYARHPQDHLWHATPWACPSSSPLLSDVLPQVERLLCIGDTQPSYNAVMSIVSDAIAAWGLEDAIQGYAVASPLDFFRRSSWVGKS